MAASVRGSRVGECRGGSFPLDGLAVPRWKIHPGPRVRKRVNHVRRPEPGRQAAAASLTLAVSYPIETKRTGNHVEKGGTVKQEVEVLLAEAGADRLDRQAWSAGADQTW